MHKKITTPWHIRIKLINTGYKEKTSEREKKTVQIEKKIRMMHGFS